LDNLPNIFLFLIRQDYKIVTNSVASGIRSHLLDFFGGNNHEDMITAHLRENGRNFR
jgi:hypothetical protein